MSKGKSRENHVGHLDVISITPCSERVGIPHRVSEDLCVEREEGVRVREGDTLEVIHRGNVEWWTVILAEDNALIHSALLEPIMGSLDASSSSIQISDCEPPPFSASGRKLVILVPFQPTGRFVDLRPPSFLTTPSSSATVSIQEKDSFVGSAITLEDGIRLLPPQVRALLDVTTSEAGELSYKKGDIIDVEARSNAEQWQGRLGSQVGMFRLDHSVEPIFKERVRAIWDYSSSSPNDLKFKAGDIIEVCGTSGASNWWLHGWMAAKGFGMFPYNFVESLEDEFPDSEDEKGVSSPLSPVEKASMRFRVLMDVSGNESDGALALKQGDIINLVERQGDDKWIGRVKLQTGTFALDNSVKPIMTDRVKAIFSYSTSNPEELPFVVDDCITVIGPSDDSTLWWYGTLNGRVGLFPLNFIELIPDERDATGDADDWVEVKVPQTLRALHNFSSKDPAILNFDANDIIKVLDVGSATDWWKGELDGRVGMFPRTYCEKILEEDEKKQGSFVLVDHEPSVFLEKPGNSFTLTLQEQNSRYLSHSEGFREHSGDTGHLAFGRGDTIEVPDIPAPNSKDTMTVSLLHSQYSQPLKGGQNQHSPIAVTIPSPKLSTITEVTTPSTRSSNDLISASPGQLTPTKASEDTPPFLRSAPSALPWVPCYARALYTFEGEGPEELSFLRGDLIEVQAMTSIDWWFGELRYQTGRVPTRYLELIDLKGHSQMNADGLASTVPTAGRSDPETTPQIGNSPSAPVLDEPRQNSRQRSDRKRGTDRETLSHAEWVRARHGWDSHKSGELVLQAGDLIQVLKRPFEHWWKGRLEMNGQVGLFPINFVEAVPSPEQPESPERLKPQNFALGSDDPVIALRFNVVKLLPLLRGFDMKRDIAENAEIQELFRTSCILRRKVLRLLNEKPDDQDLKRLDASFQEVKVHYEKLMDLCAKRALEQDAERKPRIPKPSIESGMSFERENKPPNAKDKNQVPTSEHQLPINLAKELTAQRRDTGGSMHRASLPPTPAPDSSALASMLNKRNSKGEAGGSRRYSGRLSAIEADIKRAKKAYQESIRSHEDPKPRRLPTTENSIAILRSVRDRITARRGTNVERVAENKTIHLPRMEYIHNHIVYENQQPLRKR